MRETAVCPYYRCPGRIEIRLRTEPLLAPCSTCDCGFSYVLLVHLTYKRRYVCLFVCMRAMAGRTAGPIKTKLGIGTHVDPGSVLG